MATPSKNIQLSTPAEFPDNYSPDDIRGVHTIIDWINSSPGNNQTNLARAAGVAAPTINRILSGNYPSPPTQHIQRAIEAIVNDSERNARASYTRLADVETSITKTIYSVCHRVAIYRDMGVIAGRPGVGKTHGLARYCKQHPNTLLIPAVWNMSQGILLDKLISLTDAEVKVARRWSSGTQSQKLDAVITKLSGQDRIIIIDEADLMAPSTLETLRRINDLAGIGIVLAGEPKLHAMISNKDGRFGRIYSRIGFWVPVIKDITENDCRTLIDASLSSDELSDDIHDAFWQVCDGSARVLSKLLPNVRDFGLAQGHELNPELIFSVAQKTLRLKPGGR